MTVPICSLSTGIILSLFFEKGYTCRLVQTGITHFNKLILNRFLLALTQTVISGYINLVYRFPWQSSTTGNNCIRLCYIVEGWCQLLHLERMGFASVNSRDFFILAASCYRVFPCGPVLLLCTRLKDERPIFWAGTPIKISLQKASLYNFLSRI